MYSHLNIYPYCVKPGRILPWLPWYRKQRTSAESGRVLQSLSVNPNGYHGDGLGGEGQDTDVGGVRHAFGRLSGRYHKVSVFWVCDEHKGPLVETGVSEGEEIMIDG